MSETPHNPAHGPSPVRILVLRALYALILVGLTAFLWPALIAQLPAPAHYHGVTMAMLAAFSILCALGIRYPLQMRLILLWEALWKCMWLLLIGLPQWRAGTMDSGTAQTLVDCSLVLLVLLAIPWRYVAYHYLRKPAEPPFRAKPSAGGLA
jgi:hypothetical protein